MKKSIFSVFLAILMAGTVFSTNVKKEPVYNCNNKNTNKIAITFDDGPHPRQTPKILDILKKYDVKATFFVIGVNAKNYPEPLKRAISEGHEIGNHTYSHNILKSMPRAKIEEEIFNMEKQLCEIYPYRPKLIRPPCGTYSESLVDIANDEDYKIILWTIDTHDWAHASTDNIVKNVINHIKGGDIILFHDYISGKDNTPEAIDILIPKLKSMGYEFVTVSELLRDAD